MVPRRTDPPASTWPAEPVSDAPAHEAWRSLFLVIQRLKEFWPSIAAEFDMPMAQMRVLFEVAPIAPVPMTRIADLMACDASNVTGLVDRMEQRGLLERRTDEHDRRIKLIAVTRAGLALRDKISARMAAPPPPIAALSAQEQRALAKALGAVLDAKPVS